jgi:hypothetical protein
VTTCLLCPSPVVADGLCVPCGARLWAAELWDRDPWNVPSQSETSRQNAIQELNTPYAARAFLDRLEAARKARAAAPLCSRGCVSHEDANSYGGAEESDDGA